MIQRKLSQLQYQLVGKPSTVAEKQLDAIESDLEQTLPKVYRDFLLMTKAPVYFDVSVQFTTIDPCPWADDEGMLDVIEFYGLKRGRSSLREAIDTFAEQMPPLVIPIANSSGGNQICIGIRGKAKGKVYFWDHESDLEEAKADGRLSPDLYLIATTFRNFIQELEEEDEVWNEEDVGVVEWLTDEFDTKD